MKLTSEQITQLHECLGALSDNTLSETEAEWMNSLLDQSEEAREIYVRSMRLCAHLNWDFGTVPDDADYPEDKLILGEPPNPELLKTSPTKRSKKRRKKVKEVPFYSSQKTKIALWIIAPLLLLGFFWGGFHLIQATFSNEVNEVIVTQTHLLKDQKTQTHLLQTWKKQELTEGEIEFVLPTGVKVLITAPAIFQITGENEITLTKGILLAEVTTEAGKGFTVKTPRGRIIDLGTIFGVEVEASGTSSVQVFKGRVDLFDSSGIKTPLAAGKSMRSVAGKKEWQSSKKLSTEFYKAIEQSSSDIVFMNKNDANTGLAGPENVTEALYLMYSEMLLTKRFATPADQKLQWDFCPDNFVLVHFDEAAKQWRLYVNDDPIDFAPVATDLILARVDLEGKDASRNIMGTHRISFYQENYGTLHGIAHGYQASDIQILPDWHGGVKNFADHTLKGTYFIRKPNPNNNTLK